MVISHSHRKWPLKQRVFHSFLMRIGDFPYIVNVYQRANATKTHSTTMFLWFSYGFPNGVATTVAERQAAGAAGAWFRGCLGPSWALGSMDRNIAPTEAG